jgi:hypothetical protein
MYEGAMLTGSVTDTPSQGSSFKDGTKNSTLDDFYNGGVVAFTSGALKGIARKVEDYTASSGTFTFTLNPFPAAPGNTDTYVIIGRIEG